MKLKNEKGKSWRLSYWTTRGRIGIKIALIMTLASLLWPVSAMANPYLAKPGEPVVTVRAATCAVSGGFVHRRMIVPGNMVADAVENARESGTAVRRKPTDLFDNTFAEELEKSGFLKELWGGKVP